MTRSFCFALAAATAIVTASVAASAQAVVAGHVDVVYGDLDLSSAKGRGQLESRLDSAAAMACGGSPVFASTYRDAPQFHQKDFDLCRTKAREKALAFLAQHGVQVAALH
jgi:UrcA family protein